MTISSTPEGVSVEPRHLRFDVSEDLKTLWHGNDAFRTAFFNALSLQFPDGEQQFINAVRLYRDKIEDPKLKAEIRGFIGQEALHSREHKDYNEALKARGYDIDALDQRFRKHMEWVGKLPPSRQLAGTCGAEHYTAVLANAILSHPEWMEGATPTMAKLWRWHAIEETEHKSVAFDVYRECVGNERLRRIVFLKKTKRKEKKREKIKGRKEKKKKREKKDKKKKNKKKRREGKKKEKERRGKEKEK